MTVSANSDPRVIYSGPIAIGSPMPITFPYISKSEVHCKINDTVLTYNTDYTVTGSNAFLVTQAAAATDKVTLYRVTVVDQQSEFPQNSRFDSEKVGEGFDKVCMIQQEQVAEINRTVRLSNTIEGFDSELPTPVARRALVVNSTATGFVMSTYDPDAAATLAQEAAATAVAAAASVPAMLANKQDKLTAGTNITISAENVISATAGDVPIATTSTAGKVKPDGTTVTITADGTISASGGTETPIATTTTAGKVKPDGTSITVAADGTIASVVPTATVAAIGGVKPDGTTITITADGTITSVGGGGGSGVWGQITGTITNQTDLMNKFGEKQDKLIAADPFTLYTESVGGAKNYTVADTTATPKYATVSINRYGDWCSFSHDNMPSSASPKTFDIFCTEQVSYIEIPVDFSNLGTAGKTIKIDVTGDSAQTMSCIWVFGVLTGTSFEPKIALSQAGFPGSSFDGSLDATCLDGIHSSASATACVYKVASENYWNKESGGSARGTYAEQYLTVTPLFTSGGACAFTAATQTATELSWGSTTSQYQTDVFSNINCVRVFCKRPAITTRTIYNNSEWVLSNGVKQVKQATVKFDKSTIKLNSAGKLYADMSSKQDTLVSGTNIKTINNTSLLGSGNILIGVTGQVSISSMSDTTILPSWWIIYNNGWCEQGGVAYGTIGGYTQNTVSLIKTYANTNFIVSVSKTPYDYMIGTSVESTSSFKWGGRYYDDDLGGQTTGAYVYWRTAGFIATE